MTTENSDVSKQILQQGLDSLKAGNEKANAELYSILGDLQAQLKTSFNASALGVPPTTPETPPGVADDVYYKRSMLYASQWASEVLTAAVLSEEFKQQTSDTARQILRENGMLPPAQGETLPDTEGSAQSQ